MLAFLAAIGTIAGMLALSQATNAISAARSKANKLTADDVIGIINKMVAEARNKGNETLTKLTNRLNKINTPFGMSPSVKDYLDNTRRQLNKELVKKTNDINAVEQKLNDVEQRANNLANQTDEFKYLYGKQTLDDIKDDAKKALDQSNKILGVENNV